MLLIDDDEPQPRERQEERRSRAYHDPALAERHGLPDPSAAGGMQAGVPSRRLRAEAGGEALHDGLGERDLRQQDQHLGVRVAAQHCGGRLQVDLGLA